MIGGKFSSLGVIWLKGDIGFRKFLDGKNAGESIVKSVSFLNFHLSYSNQALISCNSLYIAC